ncbi:MAG: hypothetical protein J5636_02705 [Clostridiales bacterium]|nr:hypothetical protein [Clostridiales bacterium]
MAEKTCPLCGEKMALDDFTRAWVCPMCGNSISERRNSDVGSFAVSPSAPVFTPIAEPVVSPDNESAPISLKKMPEEKKVTAKSIASPSATVSKEERLKRAKDALQSREFEKAMKDLNELRKKRFFFPQTYILTMLCGYQVCSTEELLNKYSENVPAICKIAERADWRDLAMALPREQRKYIALVIEYCAIEVVLSGNAKMILQRASGQGKKRVSTFARMDEEDVHNMERAESLKKARGSQFGKTISEMAFELAEEMSGKLYDGSVEYYSSEAMMNDAWEYMKEEPADSAFVSKLAAVSDKRGTLRATESFRTLVATKQKVKREELEKRKTEILGVIRSVESQILYTLS